MKAIHLAIIACAGFVVLVAILAALLASPGADLFFFGIAVGAILIIPLLILIANLPRNHAGAAPTVNVYSHVSAERQG